MNIETAIYIYTVICLGLTLFSIFLLPYHALQAWLLKKRTESYTKKIRRMAMQDSPAKKSVARARQRKLYRQLKSYARLMAFAKAVETVRAENPEGLQKFLLTRIRVFSKLCDYYENHTTLQILTYYTHVLGDLYQSKHTDAPERIYEFLFMRLRSNSLICRQNALSSIYRFGDCERVKKALLLLNRIYPSYQAKLLTDGLVRFTGDMPLLLNTLWDTYQQLHTDYRLALINFTRLTSPAYASRMLDILLDPSEDMELHLAAIRYLGRYPFADAYVTLLRMLGSREYPIVYAAISASALAAYPGPETVQALKAALHSTDWYVRFNASASLDKLGIDYLQLSDIINGEDRYAREIVQYRLDIMREREASAREGAAST